MKHTLAKLAFVTCAVTFIALPHNATANSPESSQAKIVERLRNSPKAERYSVPVEGQSIQAGGARILVNAPLPVVRSVLQEYGEYQNFMPRFKRSRVVGKSEKHTDVYLQVPILHGAANIWSVVQFRPPVKKADGTEIIKGRMMKGNVDDFRAMFVLTPVDANTTLLASEILIVPKLPVPGSVVTGELSYASDVAVTSTRTRAQKINEQAKSKGQ